MKLDQPRQLCIWELFIGNQNQQQQREVALLKRVRKDREGGRKMEKEWEQSKRERGGRAGRGIASSRTGSAAEEQQRGCAHCQRSFQTGAAPQPKRPRVTEPHENKAEEAPKACDAVPFMPPGSSPGLPAGRRALPSPALHCSPGVQTFLHQSGEASLGSAVSAAVPCETWNDWQETLPRDKAFPIF